MKKSICRGLLITNSFLRTDKFVEHDAWLMQAAKSQGIRLEFAGNAELLAFCGEEPDWLLQYDFIVYWDKDILLGREITRYAERKKIPIYNRIDAIAACDDKYETYYRVITYNQTHPGEEIAILPTIAAPMTYANIGYTRLDFLNQVEKKLSYPIVVKECFGSFGMQVYLAKNRQELEILTLKLAGKPFLYQKYQSVSSGRDVRLQVVGKQVVAAMYRYSETGDFRANITNGGSMKAYQPTLREKELAVRVAGVLGLDFAGVDLLFDEDGHSTILCEVNSNAHFKNIFTCTGVNVAECMIQYILARREENV